jgi:hypothetical protein
VIVVVVEPSALVTVVSLTIVVDEVEELDESALAPPALPPPLAPPA